MGIARTRKGKGTDGTARGSSPKRGRPLVLVVDDEPAILDLVGDILKAEGLETVSAADGTEAIRLAAKERPDLVLLDIMLPGLDGWVVFRKLREAPTTSKIPIVVLTARTTSIDREMGLGIVGAEDYVTKPFLPGDLVGRIRKVLAAARGARKEHGASVGRRGR